MSKSPLDRLDNMEGNHGLLRAEVDRILRHMVLNEQDLRELRERLIANEAITKEIATKVINLELVHVELRKAVIALRTDLDLERP